MNTYTKEKRTCKIHNQNTQTKTWNTHAKYTYTQPKYTYKRNIKNINTKNTNTCKEEIDKTNTKIHKKTPPQVEISENTVSLLSHTALLVNDTKGNKGEGEKNPSSRQPSPSGNPVTRKQRGRRGEAKGEVEGSCFKYLLCSIEGYVFYWRLPYGIQEAGRVQ